MSTKEPNEESRTTTEPLARDFRLSSRAKIMLGALLLIVVTSWSAYFLLSSFTSSDTDPAGISVAEAADISTTTPERVVNALTIERAIPTEGKFIAADLKEMKLYLYQDAQFVGEYPIQTKGKPGTPFETPSGGYQVLTKERNHLSTIGHVYMPFSMQFYGNYFIHGWPYYEDGTPVASSYSGGCIRLTTEDAEKVFEFAERGTKMFVYDPEEWKELPPLALAPIAIPQVSAQSFLVANIDTGEVYLEKNASTQWPIASVTKLMTALVANETISYERKIPIAAGKLAYPNNAEDVAMRSVPVGKLFYPLLMESNNAVAHTLAASYGTPGFINWMNSTAASLDMTSTTFMDASGESNGNVSTVDDLYRLAVYLVHKKSFILNISKTPTYSLAAESGSPYTVRNYNVFSANPQFIGGKVGQTRAAGETMLSVFSFSADGDERRVAIIVLQSSDYTRDTETLTDWLARASANGLQTACAGCANPASRRVIPL